jgi:hypothetical protein
MIKNHQIPVELVQGGRAVCAEVMWTCLLYVECGRIASTVEGVSCKYSRHLGDGWEHRPTNVKAFCCSQLSKVLPSVLFSRLTPYVEKMNSNHHCGFCYNRSCTDDVLCICHICGGGGGGETRIKHGGALLQLFIFRAGWFVLGRCPVW